MIMVDNDILCFFEQQQSQLSLVAFSTSATETVKAELDSLKAVHHSLLVSKICHMLQECLI